MPGPPDPAALALGRRFRLALDPRPRGGRAGDLRGTGVGSSVEFQDRRAFLPGDDLRRLDWRAYARTDRMLLRLHREEVTPVLELLVDDSRSMAVEAEKAARLVELVALLVEAARGGGWRVRLRLLSGGGGSTLELDRLLREGLSLEGVGSPLPGARALAGGLAPGSLVVLASDLLFPGEPDGLLNALLARAGRLAVLQLLGSEDQDPPVGTYRLRDAESGEEIERALDETAIATYRERLARHVAGWREACLRRGALHVTLPARVALEPLARGPLSEAGLLTPA